MRRKGKMLVDVEVKRNSLWDVLCRPDREDVAQMW